LLGLSLWVLVSFVAAQVCFGGGSYRVQSLLRGNCGLRLFSGNLERNVWKLLRNVGLVLMEKALILFYASLSIAVNLASVADMFCYYNKKAAQ
jgi:hypothetical protein